eukprot:CAMPEP_0114349002 /NCGR_PEP_ID=MMETSP0101-20121206/15188_1 /TAXON_ID=38822 ORGANISM="Pteridomonas danica, Strain PT" /NCGR_SAMPLE_ID=MMETSP0101 /ASSEMBLY_ACC=CAM_ASM_000211 /LENGTH=222 /DNA_ID=CAMNT_0001487323 /DNA_START=371 /DNA_END=1039 /DNA_ORIENTATION=+
MVQGNNEGASSSNGEPSNNDNDKMVDDVDDGNNDTTAPVSTNNTTLNHGGNINSDNTSSSSSSSSSRSSSNGNVIPERMNFETSNFLVDVVNQDNDMLGESRPTPSSDTIGNHHNSSEQNYNHNNHLVQQQSVESNNAMNNLSQNNIRIENQQTSQVLASESSLYLIQPTHEQVSIPPIPIEDSTNHHVNHLDVHPPKPLSVLESETNQQTSLDDIGDVVSI